MEGKPGCRSVSVTTVVSITPTSGSNHRSRSPEMSLSWIGCLRSAMATQAPAFQHTAVESHQQPSHSTAPPQTGGGEGRERGARGRRAPAPSSPVAKPIAPAAATALPAATPAAAPRASRAAAAAGRTEAVGEHQLLEGANLLKLHTTARPRAADQTSAQTLRRPGPARWQTNPTHPSVTAHTVTTMIAGKSCGFVFFCLFVPRTLGEVCVRLEGEVWERRGARAIRRGRGVQGRSASAGCAQAGGACCGRGPRRGGLRRRGGASRRARTGRVGGHPVGLASGGAGKGGGGGGRTSQGVGQGSVRPAAMSR